MKNYVCIVLIWLVASGGSVVARQPVIWNQGELVLMDGTELKGELGYNWKAQIVEYRAGDRIKAYSAYQVRTFTYFDGSQDLLRKFVSIDQSTSPERHRPQFMEEVFVGTLNVYREVRSVREPLKIASLSSFSTDEELAKHLENYTYLVVTGDRQVSLDEFYRTIWPGLMLSYKDKLDTYASRLKTGVASTLLRLMLINRYNYLAHQESSLENEVVSLDQQGLAK